MRMQIGVDQKLVEDEVETSRRQQRARLVCVNFQGGGGISCDSSPPSREGNEASRRVSGIQAGPTCVWETGVAPLFS